MASIFNKLNYDTILRVLDFLNDYDKIKFTSIEREMNLLKYHIKFYDEYEYKKIKHLSFIKNFKQIHYLSNNTNIPDCVTHLQFKWNFNKEIKNAIPNSIMHLTFGYRFNKIIIDSIPNNVTHLTFGNSFNQEIKNCFPNSVTHLVFGYSFNQEIKNCIPNSVTHLVFGYSFNQQIKNCINRSRDFATLSGSATISSKDKGTATQVAERSEIARAIDSVTHLTFRSNFNQEIKDSIPNSVTHLTFGMILIRK